MTGRAATVRAVAIAILTATAAGSLLMIVAGASPVALWRQLFASALGDGASVGQVLFRATPLVFTGLAVAVPLRAGLFNIGGEGQLTAAALACAVVAAALPAELPAVLAIAVAVVVAMAAGAAVGAATGALRVYRGAHEVIVAILLNTIIGGVALWLGNRGLFVGESTRTRTIAPALQLPDLGLAGSSASVSVVGAIAAAVVVAWLFARTTVGFGWQMAGRGLEAARAAGLAVDRARVSAMATAGAMAGLAGAHFVLGHKHAYEDGLGRGVGFVGVAVALLAQGRPLAIIASALLFGALAQGGLGVTGDVPKEMVDVLQAVIVLVAAASLGRRKP
ncbi:MAG: ABC transporter permease [Myxococcales bacterium]|nr:ABC transporter permease [Myxococcales bacterium]